MVTPLLAAPGPVSGPAAAGAAQAELRRSIYRHDRPSVLTRFLRWLGDRADSLFSGSGGSHALLLLLVLLLAVVVFLAVRAGVPGRRGVTAGVDADPLAPVAARDHRRLAEQYAAEGRRAEALREWLRAAVQTIEQRGVLPARPGRTGAATAREAGPLLPGAAEALSAATSAFDEVWFGGRAATDSDVAAGRAAAGAVAATRISRTAAVPSGMALPW